MASDFMGEYVFLSIGRVGSAAETIDQQIQLVPEHEKLQTLKSDITLIEGKCLIFVETKRSAEELAHALNRMGCEASYLHGDRAMNDRIRQIENFKTGKTRVLVATDLASRGLDIPNVEAVINYDCP